MMSPEPLELRDYHVAGRYQHVVVLVGKGARQKSLRETSIGSSFLCPIARSSNDQPVNHFARVLDGIGWDAAAVSVAQKDAGSLGKLGGICGHGDATPQRQQLERNDYDGSSWTHGKPPSRRAPSG
jgi:hypothetical protein